MGWNPPVSDQSILVIVTSLVKLLTSGPLKAIAGNRCANCPGAKSLASVNLNSMEVVLSLTYPIVACALTDPPGSSILTTVPGAYPPLPSSTTQACWTTPPLAS